MAHILTGAVRVSGVYRDENGVERRYTIHRGQDVASLGLPEHVVKQLLSRTRPMGGRRGAPIPYFTNVDEVEPTVVEDQSVNMAALEEATHKSRVAAGVVEPEEEPVKEVPQPPVDADGGENDPIVSTPEEAAAAVSEEEKQAVEVTVEEVSQESSEDEPVVSPTETSDEVSCSKPDCESKPDACEDDTCPVNEAPVEVAEAPTVEPEKADTQPAEKNEKKATQGKSAPKAGGKKSAKKRKPK